MLVDINILPKSSHISEKTQRQLVLQDIYMVSNLACQKLKNDFNKSVFIDRLTFVVLLRHC